MSEDVRPCDLFGVPLRAVGGRRQLSLGLSLSGGSSFHLQVFRAGGGNSTSAKDIGLIEAGLGSRWAAALRRRYPAQNRAKLIAKDFDVAVRTAKGWLSEGAPFAPVLVRAARLFGAGILGEVLMPGSDLEKVAHLDSVLQEIERRIAELGDELVVLKRGGGDE